MVIQLAWYYGIFLEQLNSKQKLHLQYNKIKINSSNSTLLDFPCRLFCICFSWYFKQIGGWWKHGTRHQRKEARRVFFLSLNLWETRHVPEAGRLPGFYLRQECLLPLPQFPRFWRRKFFFIMRNQHFYIIHYVKINIIKDNLHITQKLDCF